MIQIVKANIEYAELIAQLGKQTFLESHGHSASKDDLVIFISKTYNKEAIVNELKEIEVHYHIVYVNNQVAGFSKIVFNSPSQYIKDLQVAKLDRIYLKEEFHGMGLGSKLFNFCVELSKSNEQLSLWLYVWKENHKAVSFYTKQGFEIIGEYNFKISEKHTNPNHVMYLKYDLP